MLSGDGNSITGIHPFFSPLTETCDTKELTLDGHRARLRQPQSMAFALSPLIEHTIPPPDVSLLLLLPGFYGFS